MRKARFQLKVLLFTAIIFFGSLQGHAQHRLVLLHPTVSNIENFERLIENKIIDIPDVELIGVYYEKESYDYSASKKYISDHQINNYKLCLIKGNINPENIYRENECTPAFRKLFEEADAILFFGGPDIPAAVYGEKQNLLTVVTDPFRHYFETSLFFHLIGGSRNAIFRPFLTDRPDFIIRAFCLGMQTMNVAAGGTLMQDIPSVQYHQNTLEDAVSQPIDDQHRSYNSLMYPLADLFGGCFHPIIISKTGYLNEISIMSIGTATPKVLSYHHQAVGRMGANLNIIATSADRKIIEGLQHATFKNVVGVQFHPESSSLYRAEARFTTIPETPYSPFDITVKSNSLTFHRIFWKDFSDKINKIRHSKIN